MSSLTEQLQTIEKLRNAIEAHGKLSEDVLGRLHQKFRLECNYHSNRIEGGTLTKSETRTVMIGNITVKDKPLSDIREMKGHDEVMKQILLVGLGEVRLSERRIKDIHKTIIATEKPEELRIGAWKTEGNNIINYKNETFRFTPPEDVREAMHDLLNWLNAGLDKIENKAKDAPHPLLLAFEFHLRYLTIHPFDDGNGRTARLLTNLVVVSLGYPPFWVQEGGEKDVYNRYLGDVQGYKGSPDLLYAFLAGLVERSMRITLDAIEGKPIEDVDDWEKKLKLLVSTLPQEDLVSVAKSDVSVQEVFTRSILPVVQRLMDKMYQIDEYFVEKQMNWGHDNGGVTVHIIQDIENAFRINGWREHMNFDTSWKGFKKSQNHFQINLRVLWKLGDFHYELYVVGVKPEATLLRYKYNQFVTNDDVDNIEKICGTLLVQQIENHLKSDIG